MESARRDLSGRIEMEKFLQFMIMRQWMALKHYCNGKGIHIIGDIPIYVDYDSSDVWAHQGIFKLDGGKKPYVVAGVPPDYFSATGQLWGNPIYNWDALRARGYDWWLDRIRRNLKLFDIVRIDHFRGLVACWEVSAGETTAINGKWVDVPAEDFFKSITRIAPYPPIIAEDLGIITPDVREIIHRFEFPGMKVLLFAFGGDLATNPYIPHNVEQNSIIYTGTHDNNTIRGWIDHEADSSTIRRLYDYIGREVPADRLNWELIRMAMGSIANTAIVPVQDVLGLGREARMNTPSTSSGNWRWKLNGDELTESHADQLRHMTEIFGRT
jgi:4-alpha-glucanotransferase